MIPFITLPFILASQSPRRRQLLEWASADFEIMVSDADEFYPQNMTPAEVAVFIAQKKAEAIWNVSHQQKPVVAADTIVICENEIIGKPLNHQDACQILGKLSGKTHEVFTGVYIKHPLRDVHFADRTEVCFNTLSDAQINYYVEYYKPFDKAGAYAIQEWIGVVGIHSINGDFYNVMGLPVSKVLQALSGLGMMIRPD